MEVKGVVHLIEQTQEIGEKGFKKRLLVVKIESEYSNLVPIDFTKDNVDLLDSFSEGDAVVVGVNIGGRSWQDKDGTTRYFPSINGWRISKTDDAPEPKGAGSPMKSHAEAMEEKRNAKESASIENQDDDSDGLPF